MNQEASICFGNLSLVSHIAKCAPHAHVEGWGWFDT